MASTTSASVGHFLAVSLLFSALTGACISCSAPTPTAPAKPQPKYAPKPNLLPLSRGKCPIDALKLLVCANLLDGLITAIGIGELPKQPRDCCTLIDGLLDMDAAVCLCTALNANILGINLKVPIHISLLLSYCGKTAPVEFQCPYY